MLEDWGTKNGERKSTSWGSPGFSGQWSALAGSSASTVTECHMTGFFVTFSCHLLRKILPYCLWKKSSINPIPILSQDPVPFLYSHCLYLKLSGLSLAGWFSWLEHCPIHQKIVGLIPVQGICLGCRFDPRLGQVQEATNRCFSHTDMCVCVSLSFSLSLSLKSMKTYSWMRIKK